MQNNSQSSGLTPSPELEKYLTAMDEYDDPYFILLSCEADLALAEQSAKEIIQTYGEDVYDCDNFPLDSRHYLFSISGEAETIEAIARDMLAAHNTKAMIVHTAVFHHNCLGEPLETFQWVNKLLQKVLQRSGKVSGIQINDFSSPDGWTGIE